MSDLIVTREDLETANAEIRRLQLHVAKLRGAVHFLQQFLPDYATNGEVVEKLNELEQETRMP